jgi:hypothetical protein
MGNGTAQLGRRLGATALALSLCLFASPTFADDAAPSVVPAGAPFSVMRTDAAATPFPFGPIGDGGLDFDLGGSEQRKLQLQLDRPLSLQTDTRARLLDNGSSVLGLDAALDIPLADNFGLSAGLDRELGAMQFQSVGSIQCHNGTLRADSYTASGCRFVNEPLATTDRRRFDLGARMDFGVASASVSWFNQESSFGTVPGRPAALPAAPLIWNDGLLSPNLGNPLLAGAGSDPLQYLNSEATGVDLNFKVGIATTHAGDVQLGLAFGRILDAGFQGTWANGFEALSWTVAEPFNTARMNVEWNRGPFRGGVQGYYREPVDFLNRNSLDALATFDVHFTWRTPWNADLSVGASNVLDAGAEAGANVESQPVDPLESIYGRIPYVRYKQDL